MSDEKEAAGRRAALAVRDDQRVGETFANHVLGTMSDGATITVTLGAARAVPEKTGRASRADPHVAVVSRIVLTPKAAVELAQGLSGILGALAAKTKPEKTN
jgi:hypothetical protein